MRPLLLLLALLLLAAGCGGSSRSNSAAGTVAEASPAGDIPDNQAFVEYAPPRGGYAVKVPEGWARTTTAGAVSFTDKLNTIRIEALPAAKPPTVASAKAHEVAALASAPGFELGDVSTVRRTAGNAVLVTYRARGRADAVTGKTVPNAVERYEFFKGGKEVVLTLSGPVGADNVDPWRIVTDSLRWTA
jgi:hypothetical protein